MGWRSQVVCKNSGWDLWPVVGGTDVYMQYETQWIDSLKELVSGRGGSAMDALVYSFLLHKKVVAGYSDLGEEEFVG